MLSGIKLERFSLENFENGEFVIVANVLDKKLNKTWPSLMFMDLRKMSIKTSFCVTGK